MKYLIILFLGLSPFLKAQIGNVNFERVSAKYGLPNGYITVVIEDDFGFLWIGTWEGIFRYDGYEFKAYRHDVQDSTTLSHPSINALYEDRSGEIWAATTYGLNLLDRRTGTFQRFLPFPEEGRKSKASNHVRAIFEDSQQNLWIACRWNMFRFERASKQFFVVNQQGDPLAKHSIRVFYEDKQGAIWAGTNTGLLKLEPGDTAFQFFQPSPNSEYGNDIMGVYEDSEGSFWLGTKSGLVKWTYEIKRVETDILPSYLKNIQVSYLSSDSNGNLWIAIDQNGIGVYNIKQRQFKHLKYEANQSNSLNNNSVICIFEDSYQNIWVGTENGISKIKLYDSGFHLIQNEKGHANISNHVLRVLQDSRGGIWTKTPEGIYHIAKGEATGQKIMELEVSKQDKARGWFLEDHEGGIWLSVSGEGIFRRGMKENKFRKMPLSNMLSRNGINRMMLDNKDKEIVWLGTTEGFCRLNWKTLEEQWFMPKNDVPEIASNQISIFEQSGTDEIWLYYTYSNSLGRFDKNTGKFELFKPPTEKKAVLEGDIKDIAIGADGNLWLATLYGLSNFNSQTKEFYLFGKKEGLLENELATVLIDNKNQTWVCGNRFFSRFDHSNKTFHNYPIAKEILHFHSKSKYLAPDGTLLFGSINGVYKFHPDRIKKNQKKPNVVLTDFKVKNESFMLDKPYEKATDIALSHDENDITFAFSGLHYIDPDANKYRCKLIGFDEHWRDLGNEHKISYTNLNPGQYTFQAIAANSDDVWNEEGLTIHLIITPAFWQTLWFESLIVLVLISIGYALFKNRQHQIGLQRQKELAEQSAEYKTRFLADVSHEIRTPMNAIIGLSKLALETDLDKKQSKFIGAIQQSSQNLLTIINDLLDYTKLEAGKFTFVKKPFKLSDIIEQLNDTLKYKSEEKKLTFDLKINPDVPQELLGDPLRLIQILTNLLGNGLKFTAQGKVWLNVEMVQATDQYAKLRFEVGDTGIGIAKDQLEYIFESFNQAENKISHTEGTGLGLGIARQLVERQGGQLFIESELGKGTKFWFELEYEKSTAPQAAQDRKSNQFNIPDLKILVVEDNYFNQMLLVELLEKHLQKAEIEIAENGKIALEKLEFQSFDIIIMDVKMPVMDGYETAKKIRNSKNAALNKIPILAVTANALPEQLEKCIEAGMDDFLTKPIDEIELLNKMYSLTKNQQLIDRPKLKMLLANDEKRVQQFLDLFKSQVPEQLKLLKSKIVENNLKQVSITAHTIKSQCQYLGLEQIAALAFEIEQLAEVDNQLDSIRNLAPQLEERLMAVIIKELA